MESPALGPLYSLISLSVFLYIFPLWRQIKKKRGSRFRYRMTPPDMPIDLIFHTLGRLAFAHAEVVMDFDAVLASACSFRADSPEGYPANEAHSGGKH